MYLSDYITIAMLVSLIALLFSGFPVAFVLGGVGVAFGMIAWGFGEFALIEFFNTAPRIWGGMAANLILVAAPMFIFMGLVLDESGVAKDLLEALQVLLRRVPGGLAIAVTLVGTILAASTGIIGASVVLLSVLSLPTMLKAGYNKELAVGTVAGAGTLGIIIPPSIMLVLLADILTISPVKVFLGAFIPGLMIAGLFMVYIIVLATLKPSLAPAYVADEDKKVTIYQLTMALVPPVALITLVLGSIIAGWATATEAAGVGAAGTVFIALLKRRLSWATLRSCVEKTALMGGFIFFVLMGATVFSYVFRSLGGDDLVVRTLAASGLTSWGMLFFFMLLVFVLGFFLDWIEISLIVLPVFMPIFALLDFGSHVAPTDVLPWIAVLFALNLQTSFLTPPFAFTLFFIRGVAPPEIKLGHLYRGAIPFVILQVIGLALCVLFPQLILWLPELAVR